MCVQASPLGEHLLIDDYPDLPQVPSKNRQLLQAMNSIAFLK